MIVLIVTWEEAKQKLRRRFDNLQSISSHLRFLNNCGFSYQITMEELSSEISKENEGQL